MGRALKQQQWQEVGGGAPLSYSSSSALNTFAQVALRNCILFQLNTFSLMALHQLINHTNFTSVLCETCTKYTVSVSIDGEKRPRLDTGVGQAMESSQREFQHPSTTPHLPSVYHPPYVFHLAPTTYLPSTISSTFRLPPHLSSIYHPPYVFHLHLPPIFHLPSHLPSYYHHPHIPSVYHPTYLPYTSSSSQSSLHPPHTTGIQPQRLICHRYCIMHQPFSCI